MWQGDDALSRRRDVARADVRQYPCAGMTSLEASGTGTTGGVRFLGGRGAYGRLLARGAVLLIVTLGLYRFWLMTDVRRFLWANTEIDGETLEYAGTPLELLTGFLVAIAILVPVYAGFFLAALDIGLLGELAGIGAFLGLAVLGQYAIYRARRYRLTRTIFRGLRFTQSGSAWIYALRAVGWWILTALTSASLIRSSSPASNATRCAIRSTAPCPAASPAPASACSCAGCRCGCWSSAPLALTVVVFVDSVDWDALADAVGQGGDDVMGRVEGGNPALGEAIVFAMLMTALSALMAALLYPVFQTVVLRWWTSGLRFGEIEARRSCASGMCTAPTCASCGGAVCSRWRSPRRRSRSDPHRRARRQDADSGLGDIAASLSGSAAM